jgi:anti-sigma factor ChrR (cupin superfamily)
VELKNLFTIAEWQHEIPWEPFRDGIDIYRLYGDHTEGSGAAALLRFHRAGEVPLHEHGGYEHLFILAGSQRDQNGTIEAGTFVVSPPGSAHQVVSEAGCIVLAIYAKPVRFVGETESSKA